MVFPTNRLLILVLVTLLSSFSIGQRPLRFSRFGYPGPNNFVSSYPNSPRKLLNHQPRVSGDDEQRKDYGYIGSQLGPINGINRGFYRQRNENLRQTPTQFNYEKPIPQQLKNQRQSIDNQYGQVSNSYPPQNLNQNIDYLHYQEPIIPAPLNQRSSKNNPYNQDKNFYPSQTQTPRQSVSFNLRRKLEQNKQSTDLNRQKLIELFSSVQTLNGKLDPVLQHLRIIQNSIQRIEQQTQQNQPQNNQPQEQIQPKQQIQPQQKAQTQQQIQPQQQTQPQQQIQPLQQIQLQQLQSESPHDQSQYPAQQKEVKQSSPNLFHFFVAPPTNKPTQLKDTPTNLQSPFKYLHFLNIPTQ